MDVRTRARALAGCAAATIALALAPRPLEIAILAATAGTLFEAAPFVLLASLLPPRLRGLARSAGCGCGGPGALPGALAPVAIAVCWLSFGPAIAIARAVAAAIPAVVRGARAPGPPRTARLERRFTRVRGWNAPPRNERRHASAAARGDETFRALRDVAASSAATALVAPHLDGLATIPGLATVAGLTLGAIVPCATAGVALAAGCASRDPWLAAGVLVTAGIVPRLRLPEAATDPAHPATPQTPQTPRGGRFAVLLLAVALAGLAVRGGAGLVNPRLVPLAALAAVVAVARAIGPAIPSGGRAAAVPAVMLSALIAGSPEPPYRADETTVPNGFPGEPATFTGAAHADRTTTRIVRFSITCCRLDATALAVTLDRRLAVRDGTWLRVRGRFVLRDGRLVLHAERAAVVPEPPDPFVYR